MGTQVFIIESCHFSIRLIFSKMTFLNIAKRHGQILNDIINADAFDI